MTAVRYTRLVRDLRANLPLKARRRFGRRFRGEPPAEVGDIFRRHYTTRMWSELRAVPLVTDEKRWPRVVLRYPGGLAVCL